MMNNTTKNNSYSSCPNIDTLRQFYLGRLNVDTFDVIQEHLDSCESCDKKLDFIQLEQFEIISDIRKANSPLAPESEQIIELKHKLHNLPYSENNNVEQIQSLQFPQPFGNYILLKVLGNGGMGTVYLAENKVMKRLTAIKVVHPHLIEHQSDILTRFQHEILAAAKLDHLNLIRAYEAGVVDQQPYLAMEYLEGDNLSQLIHWNGVVNLDQAVGIIIQAATGIKVAHDAGMIHRDIKPSNIILTKSGNVKVLDLGLALLPTAESLTTTGQILGTIQYMAPEQLEDASKVDPRTDVYSLAATLYKLLTGISPLGDQSRHPMKYVADLLNMIPARVDQLRPEIPEAVADFLTRCLSKNREHRPATMDAFIQELNTAFTCPKSLRNIPSSSSIHETIQIHERQTHSILNWKYLIPVSLVCLGLLILGFMIQPFLKEKMPLQTQISRVNTNASDHENTASDLSKQPLTIPASLDKKSIWDQLSKDSIPQELRKAWHPKELVGIIGGEAQHEWGPIKHLAFSHDGEFLAYTIYYTNSVVLKLRSTKDMKELASLTHDDIKPSGKVANYKIQGIHFLPDGKLLTVQYSGECTLWKYQNNQLNKVKFWMLDQLPVNASALSPDGKTLATHSGWNKTIHIYNLNNSDQHSRKLQVDQLIPRRSNAIYLKYATDSSHLLSTDHIGNALIWDTSKEVPELKFSQRLLNNDEETWVGISPDGRQLAARKYGEHDMHIWSVEEKKEIQNINVRDTGREAPVFVGKTNPALLTNTNELRLHPYPWKSTSSFGLGSLGMASMNARVIYNASPDGRFIASTSHQGEFIRLWKVSSSGDLAQEIGYPSDINETRSGHRLAFSPDGNKVVVITDANDYHFGHFDIWTIKENKLVKISSQRISLINNSDTSNRLYEISFASDSKTEASAEFLRHLGKSLPADEKYKTEIIFQPPLNRECAVISKEKLGSILSIKPGESSTTGNSWLEQDWKAHNSDIHRIQFSPSGKILASYAIDRELKIWDMTTWPPKLLDTFQEEKNDIELNRKNIHLEFSPDDTYLYFTSSKLWSWKLTEDQPRPTSLKVRLSNQAGDSLAVSPDGKKLLICGFEDNSQSVILWDVVADKILQSWLLPGQVLEAEFAPDGKHIGWLNANGSAYILKLKTIN